MIVIFFLLLLFFLYVFLFVRPSFKAVEQELKTDYAHRGLHGEGVAENSLAAFRRAVECGFGIELDVQLSSDGEVMVFHDESLTRMTGDERRLSDVCAAELQTLRLGESDERIPTLRDVLREVDGKVPLLVELKGEDTNTALCPKVDAILSEYRGAYCVESFNPILLAWYKKHRPDVTRGLLTTSLCREKKFSLLHAALDLLLLNVAARPDFIAYDIKYPTRFPLLLAVKFWAADTFSWTVRTQDEYDAAKKRGADTIFEGFIPKK